MDYRRSTSPGARALAASVRLKDERVDTVLAWLIRYAYLAMFGILTLCGVGLPLPEEVTLLGSGLLVGWHEADFFAASLACGLGILAGDSIIFGLGYHFGGRFLLWPPMQVLLTPTRQAKVQQFFLKHGTKALFMARFVPGVRIGVYAYAGSQRIRWRRFLGLDAAGVLLSGPLSIWVGMHAARAFGDDRVTAIEVATERLHSLGHWAFLLATAVVALAIGANLLARRLKLG